MKKNIPTLVILLSGFLITGISSFRLNDLSPSDRIHSRLNKDVDAFLGSIDQLDRILGQKQASEDPEQWVDAFSKVRDDWKRIEYFISYFDPQFVRDHLNGAPLPSVERKVPGISVLEPSGMQPLEEALFGDETVDLELARKLAHDLRSNAHILLDNRAALKMTDAKILAACRIQVLRVTTLGITGFDSPVLARSVTESARSLEGVNDVIAIFSDLLETTDSELHRSLLNHLSASIYVLNGSSFEDLNRIDLIRDHLDPAFQILGELHKMSGLELPSEYQTQISALNYTASSMFGNDLLNPYFYTSLTEELDNAQVRELGKLLFFDPILSGNLERSCSSCHLPEKAFTDGRKKSLAMGAQETVDRNAPTLVNAVYAERFFYDLRASPLESQFEHVVFNEKEFHSSYAEASNRLNESEEYIRLFQRAFPSFGMTPVNKTTISYALASYVASLRSFNSPVDRYLRSESSQLSDEVKNGFNLFMGKAACGTCHFAPTFAGTVPPAYQESESEVLGVPTTPDTVNVTLDPDIGRYGGNMKDKTEFYKFSFKTLTVRNVAYTAPYMHNGVYETLDQIVDFYNRGGGAGMGMDLPYQTLPFDELNLSKSEQEDLVSFMKALSDTTGLTDRPIALPGFEGHPEWNTRKIGGLY